MAIQIGSNFKYTGALPNFERDLFKTKAALKAYPEEVLPSLFIAQCEEDGKVYQYNAKNTVDPVTGKWREFKQGGDQEIIYPYKDTDGTFYACGFPTYIEPNTGKKYSDALPEDAVIACYYYGNNELKWMELDPTKSVMGGFGPKGGLTQRELPNTKIVARNVTLRGISAGHYTNGIVGTTEIEVDNCTISWITGGGFTTGSNGNNIVYKSTIKVNNLKGCQLLFAGPNNGDGVVDECLVYIDGAETSIDYLTTGGSNGLTRTATVVLNDGNIKVAQGVNRGHVDYGKLVVNGGTIQNLYAGGEVGDATVTGTIDKFELVLNGGTVKNIGFGTSGGVLLDNMTGTIYQTTVEAGDYSQLTRVDKYQYIDDTYTREEADKIFAKAGSGTESTYNGTAAVSIGGLKAGTDLSGMTANEILTIILNPHVEPTITFSHNAPKTLLEKAVESIDTLTLTTNITKKTTNIASLRMLVGNQELAYTPTDISNGGVFTATYDTPIVTTTTVKAIVDDGVPPMTERSITFTFVDACYYGWVDANATIDATLKDSMTKVIKTGSTQKIVGGDNPNVKYAYLIPKSFANANGLSCYDNNGFNMTDSTDKQEIQINAIDYILYIAKSGATVDNSYSVEFR